MILIVVKFTVRPEQAEQWPDLVAEFTKAVRAEPGNLTFEWSRSIDDPNTYVLVEAFADAAAGEVHVKSEHFSTAMAWMPTAIATKPKIIHVDTPGDGWSEMAELTPTNPAE